MRTSQSEPSLGARASKTSNWVELLYPRPTLNSVHQSTAEVRHSLNHSHPTQASVPQSASEADSIDWTDDDSSAPPSYSHHRVDPDSSCGSHALHLIPERSQGSPPYSHVDAHATLTQTDTARPPQLSISSLSLNPSQFHSASYFPPQPSSTLPSPLDPAVAPRYPPPPPSPSFPSGSSYQGTASASSSPCRERFGPSNVLTDSPLLENDQQEEEAAELGQWERQAWIEPGAGLAELNNLRGRLMAHSRTDSSATVTLASLRDVEGLAQVSTPPLMVDTDICESRSAGCDSGRDATNPASAGSATTSVQPFGPRSSSLPQARSLDTSITSAMLPGQASAPPRSHSSAGPDWKAAYEEEVELRRALEDENKRLKRVVSILMGLPEAGA